MASPRRSRVADSGVASQLQIGGSKCAEYRVDMSALTFGQCVCGKAKADHNDDAFKSRSPRSPSVVEVNVATTVVVDKVEEEEAKTPAEAATEAKVEDEKAGASEVCAGPAWQTQCSTAGGGRTSAGLRRVCFQLQFEPSRLEGYLEDHKAIWSVNPV